MERKLRDFLRTHTALTNKVPDTNIFGPVARKVTDNYITIHLISKPRGLYGARNSRIQISVFNKVYGEAKDIADIVEEAVMEFTEGFARFNDNQIDIYEKDTEFHHIVIDVILYEQEKVIYNE